MREKGREGEEVRIPERKLHRKKERGRQKNTQTQTGRREKDKDS